MMRDGFIALVDHVIIASGITKSDIAVILRMAILSTHQYFFLLFLSHAFISLQ